MSNDTATQSLTDQLQQTGDEAVAAIAAADDLDALDGVRQAFLGKKGRLSLIKRQLGGMPPEQRKSVGQAVNDVNARVGRTLEDRRAALELQRDRVVLAAEAVDVTLPPRVPRVGSLHPLRQTL
ncbi:MAG TPA: hypothetical protein VMM13_10975, partial [Euzebya sp.]|nr:hypothetical protein [Euzebya sp.]